MYQIFKGQELIGYIHGVNQKGQYGGIQVFLALDLEGNIRGFYFQKMTGQYAKLLRDPDFGKQFVGLNLNDFKDYDVVAGAGQARQPRRRHQESGPPGRGRFPGRPPGDEEEPDPVRRISAGEQVLNATS